MTGRELSLLVTMSLAAGVFSFASYQNGYQRGKTDEWSILWPSKSASSTVTVTGGAANGVKFACYNDPTP